MDIQRILILVFCCLFQAHEGLAGKNSRGKHGIAWMLRKLKRDDFLLLPSSTPVPVLPLTGLTPVPVTPFLPTANPSTAPVTPPDFYRYWPKCPILETFLSDYFHDFPDVTKATDYFFIKPREISRVFNKAAETFAFLKNVRVTVDQMTEDLVRLILNRRVNCTVTMYQRVFVFYIRNEVNNMLSHDVASIRSQIEAILRQHFPDNPMILTKAEDLVRGLHSIVFDYIIEFFQEEEFGSLEWFLESFQWSIRHNFEQFYRGEFGIADLATKIQSEFLNSKTLFPDALECTTSSKFIDIHRTVAREILEGNLEFSRSGVINAFATSQITMLLKDSAIVPAPADNLVDMAVVNLVDLVLDYVNDTMNVLAEHERSLSQAVLTKPPDFLETGLDPSQYRVAVTLFNRIFGLVPPGSTPSGPDGGLTRQEVVQYLQQDIGNLNMIKALTPTCQNSGNMTAILDDMIQAKEQFINMPAGYYRRRYYG